MIYDEEKLDLAMSKEDYGEVSRMYHQLKEMFPYKLKILRNTTCKRCGFCCRSCNAMISKQDIEMLCKYLQCSFEEFYEKYMDKNTRIPYLKLPCPFLNKDNDCDVYPARPKVCKEFPFNEYNLIIEPCELGKEIRGIIEEICGPITGINEDMQIAADQSDRFFHHMIKDGSLKDTGTHLRVNINMTLLEKMIGYIKHKKKMERKNR